LLSCALPFERGILRIAREELIFPRPILSGWKISLSGGRNQGTFRNWQSCVTACGPRRVPLNTPRNWTRCWRAIRPDLCPLSFSWPKSRAAALSDLSRLICDRMRTVATRPVRSVTSRDGMLRLHTGEEESEEDSLRRLRTGLEVKVVPRWLPMPGWRLSTHNVRTKRSASRLWIAVYIIERICD